jgi:hypothetical protein
MHTIRKSAQTGLNHKWSLLNHATEKYRHLASGQYSGSKDVIKAVRTTRDFINQIVTLIIV